VTQLDSVVDAKRQASLLRANAWASLSQLSPAGIRRLKAMLRRQPLESRRKPRQNHGLEPAQTIPESVDRRKAQFSIGLAATATSSNKGRVL
jgi:hypothetical protein